MNSRLREEKVNTDPASINPVVYLSGLDKGVVPAEIFSDSKIFDLEMDRVFGSTWLFVAHEGQLPRNGDYVTTYMGIDPVIVLRQSEGSVAVFLNACRHRGMKVCRTDAGNAKNFTCTYHGWSYATDGRLLSVPMYREAYHQELEKNDWGLIPVPRIESYKGLIYACWDADAEPLVDYLGDMKWFLDMILDRREGGTEPLAGPHRIRMRGNWKLAAEQFGGDTLHGLQTHGSAFMAMADSTTNLNRRELGDQGRQLSFAGGHGVAGFAIDPDAFARELSRLRALSPDFSLVADYLESTKSEVQNRLGVERVGGAQVGAGLSFPNTSFLSMTIGNSSVGTFHPKSPLEFEYWRIGLVDKAAPKAVKQAMARNWHVWPLGLADADDGENWAAIADNLRSPRVQQLNFNYQMGLGHADNHDPVYPGTVLRRYYGEEAQRGFYHAWRELMTLGGTD